MALEPTRGETMILQPRLISYGSPMDLTHAYTVFMLYKPVGSTNVYSVSGGVLNATNGQVQVTWTASNETSASSYAWDVLVSDGTTTVVGARGAIKFREGPAYNARMTTNTPIYVLDFATVNLLNVGYAPFLSSYEIADVRAFLETIQNGTGDIDCDNMTIRGSLNYTNWPSYLARTSDVPAQVRVAAGANITVAVTTNSGIVTYTVTGAAGGGGGGVGTYTNTIINGVVNTSMVSIADGSNLTWAAGTDGVWRANAGIPASWSSTGTLYWVVNGETIGRVDSNGITLLKGSLSLYEDDLTCNVRLYDGSRLSPSLTPQGHPGTWGLFIKSYSGSYSAAWSQNSNEVGVLHLGGITLTRTNSYFSGRHSGDISEATIGGQTPDTRYPIAPTGMTAFVITNAFGGSTNVLYYSAQGVVTNRVPL